MYIRSFSHVYKSGHSVTCANQVIQSRVKIRSFSHVYKIGRSITSTNHTYLFEENFMCILVIVQEDVGLCHNHFDTEIETLLSADQKINNVIVFGGMYEFTLLFINS